MEQIMNQTDVKVSFYLKKSEADAKGNCPVMARLIVGKYSETANVGQQHPHYPQGEIPMFPHHEEPPMPEELQQAYMHEGPAYRPEDYEEYPDFPQSMLENHYSQAYAQTV